MNLEASKQAYYAARVPAPGLDERAVYTEFKYYWAFQYAVTP